MSFALDPADVQSQTLWAYTLLRALSAGPDPAAWAGALILNVHLDSPGTALSLAANIAGAICLTLEPNPACTRAALRVGACDFVVNTLDEALRAIKNEIRQRRPLSVALQADSSTVLDQIVARGLAPQLFTAPMEHTAATALVQSGTRMLDLRGSEDTIVREAPGHNQTAAAVLETFLAGPPFNQMFPRTISFATGAELRAFDTRAMSLLSPDDSFRHRWLVHAPRLFPRDRARSLWITQDELIQLAAV